MAAVFRSAERNSARKALIGRGLAGKHPEVILIADLLARVDVDPDGHGLSLIPRKQAALAILPK
jgi:hypothetical protein